MTAIECEFSIEGQGEPLILIHGIGADRSIWRFMMPTLREHFKVISYDLRNHGQSPMSAVNFGLDKLVDDLELVRQRSGVDKAHFAGHSLGGMIGPAYARKYPDFVKSLGCCQQLLAAQLTTASRSGKWFVQWSGKVL